MTENGPRLLTYSTETGYLPLDYISRPVKEPSGYTVGMLDDEGFLRGIFNQYDRFVKFKELPGGRFSIIQLTRRELIAYNFNRFFQDENGKK